MNPRFLLVLLCSALAVSTVHAAEPITFTDLQITGNKEVVLTLSAPAGTRCRLDASADLVSWDPLVTLPPSTGIVTHTDTAAPFLTQRFYRAAELPGTPVTGDHLPTSEGDVLIHPVEHATLVLIWNGVTIYADPGSDTGPFTGIAPADIILITHHHGDHFNTATVNSILQAGTQIIAGQYVYDNSLSTTLRAQTTILANGQSAQTMGLTVQAVPMYNIPPGTIYHPQGQGNGYLLTIGGKRIYISGDTEDTTEMRALASIDVAFLAMNQPFTMTVDQASSAARAFRPRVVYPYHYSNSDLNSFKQMVGTDLGIEVRLRDWYP